MSTAQLPLLCGYLQCTCEKYPKIIYMNEPMKQYLIITEETCEWFELLKENIYFMVPSAERASFQGYLNAAMDAKEPLHVKHPLLRSDGSRITLAGLVGVSEPEPGQKHFALFYFPTKEDSVSPPIDLSPYLQLLSHAYHIIFQLDYITQKVECIYGYEHLEDIHRYNFQMTMETAKNYWLDNYIPEEDHEQVTQFYKSISPSSDIWKQEELPQVNFHLRSSKEDKIYDFLGVAMKLNDSNILLCCKNIPQGSIKQQPTGEENLGSPRKANAPQNERPFSPDEIFARTFGHFDLFLKGSPVVFSSAKEKELMALLVDRRGGTLASNEAVRYLWPDEEPGTSLSNRYCKLTMRLHATLRKYDIEYILINKRGVRSIDTSTFICDYYEMLNENPKYRKTFSGSYMADYGWGRETLATLQTLV